MNYIKDLNIETELLPLFDYSLNGFTKNTILILLKTALTSEEAIIKRQNILKGFGPNHSILKEYSYTVLYLNETYNFTNDGSVKDLSLEKFNYKWLTSKSFKLTHVGKFNQLILFFNRLKYKYFSRLNLEVFPKEYAENIKRILLYLSFFNTSQYEKIIRESRLKDQHIIALSKILYELRISKKTQQFWEDLFLFEAYLAISLAHLKNGFVRPTFNKEKIELKKFYNPLLINPVKNDFSTRNNVILLNGPNMSGKSTFLKSVSICMYLAHLGLSIPAQSGNLKFVNYFSVNINKNDQLLNGYSHFMSEIMNLKDVLLQVRNNKSCFAVFDELFSSTNVEDAFEVCKSTIQGLSQFSNSFFFISTHIQQLKTISHKNCSHYFIDCQLVDGIPKFNYTIKPGWSNVKVGQILFEKEGLNNLLKDT